MTDILDVYQQHVTVTAIECGVLLQKCLRIEGKHQDRMMKQKWEQEIARGQHTGLGPGPSIQKCT